MTQARRRDGQTIAFAYDNLLRVSALDAPGTGDDVAYVYDLFSRILSAAKAGQTLTFAYDALSRLTSAGGPLGAVAYQYDAGSRRTRMTWPDGFFVAHEYDVAGAVTAIRENGAASGAGVLASFAYDDLGRRISLTRGNSAVTSYAYDAASRLATLTQNLPGTSHDQTYGFSYNTASQITQRTSTNAAYNAPTPFNGTTAYADNGLNQYTSVAGAAPTYDTRGNLTAFNGATYAYDVFNRLISATPAGGTAATLAYDALGRLREVAAASITRFLYDGLDAIAEYNASNVLQRRYVHGPGVDEPLVQYEGAGTTDRRYLVQDERGSVVAINAATNSVNAYDEYGTPAASNTGRFQYTGQMWLAEAGVYHYKARAYVPQLGRFAQTDPIGFGGGMNFYGYVANDPVNFTDPLGLQQQSCPARTGSRIRRCGEGSSHFRSYGSYGGGGGSGGGGNSPSDRGGGGDENEIVVIGYRYYDEIRLPRWLSWIFASDGPDNVPAFVPGTSAQVADWIWDNGLEQGVRVHPVAGAALAAADCAGGAGCDPLAFIPGRVGTVVRAARRPRCCFVAGTLVTTREGLVPIEQIEVGDLVLSRDPETGETGWKPVTALIPGHERDLWTVTLDVGASTASFGTTDDHPWRTADGRWLRTDELQAGMAILRAEGAPARVVSATNTGQTAITYNLTVADWETYFVGEARVWVHNCTPFAPDGTLTPEALAASRMIIPNSRLGNQQFHRVTTSMLRRPSRPHPVPLRFTST